METPKKSPEPSPDEFQHIFVYKTMLKSYYLKRCCVIGGNGTSTWVQIKFEDGHTAIVPRQGLRRAKTTRG